jgi:hypothetical protein
MDHGQAKLEKKCLARTEKILSVHWHSVLRQVTRQARRHTHTYIYLYIYTELGIKIEGQNYLVVLRLALPDNRTFR